MNRLKLLKIMAPTAGILGLGGIGGAVGYFVYKTAPEKWNKALTEFREVHVGFDGNQMISYLATGEYAVADANGAPTNDKKLIYWEEKEMHKTIFVLNHQTGEKTKYELNYDDKNDDSQKSIVWTLPGKQGDKFTIVVESKGIKYRQRKIREDVFAHPEHVSNYDDEDIKEYTRTAGAEFQLTYYDADVTLMGIDGTVDTPAIGFIKNVDFDDFDKNHEVKEATLGLIDKGVTYGWMANVPLGDQDVLLHAIQINVKGMIIGKFQEEATSTTKLLIPRAMGDVSPQTQLIDHDITVQLPDGKKVHLGELKRYDNELTIEADDIYGKADDNKKAGLGDIKATSWW